MTIERPLGLVLAGGLARRMGGGDKARIRIGGKTILERVLGRLTPQCTNIILNANGDPGRFADTGLAVVPDTVPDFAGPLAGILAGLDWAAAHVPEIADVVSVPGDCPFLPRDLVPRLVAAREAKGLPLACARSGEWRHPVVGLWPVRLRADLRQALVNITGDFQVGELESNLVGALTQSGFLHDETFARLKEEFGGRQVRGLMRSRPTARIGAGTGHSQNQIRPLIRAGTKKEQNCVSRLFVVAEVIGPLGIVYHRWLRPHRLRIGSFVIARTIWALLWTLCLWRR